MSREVLQELVEDVRRLVAAGTAGSAGDSGLRRRAQVLPVLAAKVPALAGVAGAVGRVLQATPSGAAASLCDLLHLTRQLQAGLASAGCDGAAVAVEKSGPWQTAAAVRDVIAWSEASYHPDSNDLTALRRAVARRDFADLRLVQPLVQKLALPGSGEGEDLLGDRALPAYGAALLPDLRRDLDLKGGVAHARRLRTICAIDPKLGTNLCRQALAEGSSALKVQALRCLTRLAPTEAEGAALQMLESRASWELKVAALPALATSRTDGALEAVLKALRDEGGFWGLAEDLMGALPHPRATARLLDVLGELLTSEAAARTGKAAATAKGKKGRAAGATADEVREQITRVVRALGERKDAAAVPALMGLLEHKNSDVRESAIDALGVIGDPAGLRAAVECMNDGKVWESAARAAWRLPARERYDHLAPWVERLSSPKKSEHRRGKFVLDLFEEEFGGTEEQFFDPDEFDAAIASNGRRTDWDPRWEPLLRKYLNGPYRPDAALGLAAVLGDKAIPELLPLLVPSVKKGECGVVEALGCLKAREAVPAMVELMPGQTWHHYCIHDALRRINDPAALPLLEALLAKTKDPLRRTCLVAVIDYLEKRRPQA